MAKTQVGILTVITGVCILVAATIQHRSKIALREDNDSLRQQLSALSRLSGENQRFSNLLVQARAAQAGENERLQELFRLRAEVSRLSQEVQESNRVDQARMAQAISDQSRELAALRSGLSELGDEISGLREEVRQLPELDPNSQLNETADRPGRSSNEDQSIAIRMINVHSNTFAERLKNAVAAEEGETFQEVFGRFLQDNGIDVNTVAGLVLDERNGRVIVRAPKATLDRIERLTVRLDQSQ